MEEQSRLVSYRQGENIFRRGDGIYSVYLVCQGTVIISSAGINGDEMGGVFVQAGSTTARYQHYEAAMRVKMFLAEKGVGRVKDTRSALAEACGVSERTINRAVASLEKDGYISINRGEIDISQQQLIMIQLSILEEE